MNFKTALLTTAAVMMTSSAAMAHHTNKKMETKAPTMVADITSPFYLPSEGKMLSDTSIEYDREKSKRAYGHNSKSITAIQRLYYGITDKWSVQAILANDFDTQDEYNNDHNFTYGVGTAYNFSDGNMLGQVGVEYITYDPEEEGYTGSASNWEKEVNFNAKLGYQMSCGLIPYVDFTAQYELNEVGNNPAFDKESDWSYSTFAGVHKKFEKTSMDLGVRWENDRDYSGDLRKSENYVYAEGKYNYFLSDTMTVGVYGGYLVGGTYMGRVDDDYTLGANLKVAF